MMSGFDVEETGPGYQDRTMCKFFVSIIFESAIEVKNTVIIPQLEQESSSVT